jgi:hypothetical protein
VSAGCALGAVTTPAHTPQPGSDTACATLVAALPDVVADAVRREVQPESAAVAAWGQPPVILRCGVEQPSADPGVAVLDVDGVGWVPVAGDGGTFFTTVDRSPRIEVAVPDDYAPEAEVLVDLAPAIRSTVPADAT